MTDYSLRTAVAFFIFKRPATTLRVFDAIAQARPPRLFVIADGPRTAEDIAQCNAARAIVEQIDWPCEVKTNYAEANMGLKRRFDSGLRWLFDQVEEAIILEDDCLPDPSFFRFCEELLERYRDDERIMHISGDNFLYGKSPRTVSYYFSRYPHIWGWATWRRAWRYYDTEMTAWIGAVDKNVFLRQFDDPRERLFWRETWDKVCTGVINTWDYQWTFACLSRAGLCINPSHNLVANIGFGAGATHTVGTADHVENPVMSMEFPLIHPREFSRDLKADRITAHAQFRKPTFAERVVRKARSSFQC
jgi:hypothetical protein